MLETVREYAWEQLMASGEAESMQHRHADYYLLLVAGIKQNSQALGTWLNRLAWEHDNLRAALRWLLEWQDTGEDALRLLLPIRPFWERRTQPASSRDCWKGRLHTPVRVLRRYESGRLVWSV